MVSTDENAFPDGSSHFAVIMTRVLDSSNSAVIRGGFSQNLISGPKAEKPMRTAGPDCQQCML
jgi:hypothetical protein